MIDVDVAQNIVDSMKAIINQEVNYMSTDGIIIASTDQERIGDQHGGAKKVLKTEKPLIIHFDEEYSETKQGINLPVLLNNSIVGVIGITGSHDEVSKYGEIIKQMTEILIRDNIAKDIIYNKRNTHQFIIDYIMGNNTDAALNPGLINYMYDMDFTLNRIAITGVLREKENLTHEVSSRIYNILHSLIGANENNIFDVRNGLIVLIIEITSLDSYKTPIENLLNQLRKSFSSDLVFGIGTQATSISSLKESIKNSYTALSWNLNSQLSEELYYDEMEYGTVLHDILSDDKSFFIDKVFKDTPTEEVEDFCELLDIYERNNGSIKKCAEELFIHKNTVQYQLNKIKTFTGYDPRQLKDFFTLKLAMVLYRTL